jgi:glucokinase-like ROK family protein
LDYQFPGLHVHYFKNMNKHAILDIIRFTPGGVSRAELARQTELTRSAISSIVDDFIIQKLVRETAQGPAQGGRRPILLELDPTHGCVVGIDIGASHVGIVVTDFAAQLRHELEFSQDINKGPEACLSAIDSRLRGVLTHLNLSFDEVLAIGVGVPGPVVIEKGLVSAPPIMPGWDNFPIQAHLISLWKVPVSLNNDAELGAMGEWAYGAGRGSNHLVYIKVGTGVGSGLLLDGQIYRGATGCAGEIGHITIQENGPLCSCGSYGCLEAFAGGRAIARKAREAVLSGRRTQLASIEPIEAITARDVAEAARLGDLVAQQIITTAGGYLGIAIGDLVNLFNPSLIVIGGGVAQIGDLLLDPIRRVVRERSLQPAAQAARITAAVLGRRSSSMGAIVQAISIALHQQIQSVSV